MKRVIIFTIDVEEWFMAENVKPYVSSRETQQHSSLYALENLLAKLDARKIKATLFVVAELLNSDQFLNLLLDASKRGHEVASHSYSHRLLDELSKNETELEVVGSIRSIREKLGVPVHGFRSPCFTTNQFLDSALIKAGASYTSNGISATLHDRYSKKPRPPELLDIAIPTGNIFGFKFPATGGGWFRLFPLWFQRIWLKDLEYTTFYCHPWDFDSNQPHLKKMSCWSRFRHTVNNKLAFDKLDRFLRYFDDSMTCQEYADYQLANKTEVR